MLYIALVALELSLVLVTDKAVSLPSEEALEIKAVLKIMVLPPLPQPCLALSFEVHCQYKKMGKISMNNTCSSTSEMH